MTAGDRIRSAGFGHDRTFANGGLAATSGHQSGSSRSRRRANFFQGLVEQTAVLIDASHLHCFAGMKTSTLPAVRVEPALRGEAEAILDEGESLSDIVASCVRDGVAWAACRRRVSRTRQRRRRAI